MLTIDHLLMTTEELTRITGGYVQPAATLAELHRQGFWRARRSRITGEVLLERAHYEAVCAGQDQPVTSSKAMKTPQLRPA